MIHRTASTQARGDLGRRSFVTTIAFGLERASVSKRRWPSPLAIGSTLYTLVVVSTLNDRLVEGHAFRQSQTAFIARQFAANGINLFRPVVPVYGPNSAIPFELPWFQAIASLGIRYLHLPEAVALRGTALLGTLLTALFLQRLVKRFVSAETGQVAALLYLFTPFTLQWGRSSLIESFTTAVTLLWLLVVTKRNPTTSGLLLGTLIGAVAWTSKLTTAASWAIVVTLALSQDFRANAWRKITARVGSVAVSAGAGLLWSNYADTVKLRSNFTADLTMAAIRTFNFGTPQQRLIASTWETIFGRTMMLMLGGIGIGCVVAGILVWKSTNSALPLCLAGVILLPLLTFTNLYVVHDYYQAAIAPAFAGLEAIGLLWIVNRFSPRGYGSTSRAIGVIIIVVCSMVLGRGYVKQIFHGKSRYTVEAKMAGDVTPPGDGIAVSGLGWDPEFLYQTGHWGFALDSNKTTKMALQTEFGKRLTTLVVAGSIGAEWRNFLSAASWIAPISAYTYRVGWEGVRESGTEYPLSVENTTPTLDAQATSKRCTDTFEFAPQSIEYSVGFDGSQISDIVLNNLGPVPLQRGVVRVRPGTALTLACAGPSSASLAIQVLRSQATTSHRRD